MTIWTKSRVNSYIMTLLDKYEERTIVNKSFIQYKDWTPLAKMCRHNVAECCELYPTYSPIHGWLCIEDFNDKNNVIFVSHSVVRRPSGALRDITPTICTAEYSFLNSYLNEYEYMDLINHGYTKLSTKNLCSQLSIDE
jgi:hypothetical protein